MDHPGSGRGFGGSGPPEIGLPGLGLPPPGGLGSAAHTCKHAPIIICTHAANVCMHPKPCDTRECGPQQFPRYLGVVAAMAATGNVAGRGASPKTKPRILTAPPGPDFAVLGGNVPVTKKSWLRTFRRNSKSGFSLAATSRTEPYSYGLYSYGCALNVGTGDLAPSVPGRYCPVLTCVHTCTHMLMCTYMLVDAGKVYRAAVCGAVCWVELKLCEAIRT